MVVVPQEAAGEVDAGGDGRQAQGELHPGLRVAEAAVGAGEVAHALPQAVHAVRGGGPGDGGDEVGGGDVLRYLFHGVHEADVERLGVLGLFLAADPSEHEG